MAHKLEDLGRRNIDFRRRSIKEALPEYFTSEYPDLIDLLDNYYAFLDSDGKDAFDAEIHQLNIVRDVGQTPSTYLDNLINETTGLQTGGLFKEPRFTLRRFADFYRTKGSRFSAEEFFQAFYQQDAVVEYPKKDIFTIGQDKIGYEAGKYITDNARYQIFSILVKVGLSTSQYETLYKKFVHPAGFYFEGEVVTEAEAGGLVDSMIISAPGDFGFLLQSEVTIQPDLFTSVTGLVDSGDMQYRYDLNLLVSAFQDLSSTEIDTMYRNIHEAIDANSFTLDDSDKMTLSNTLETIDNDMFTRYLSDSSF